MRRGRKWWLAAGIGLIVLAAAAGIKYFFFPDYEPFTVIEQRELSSPKYGTYVYRGIADQGEYDGKFKRRGIGETQNGDIIYELKNDPGHNRLILIYNTEMPWWELYERQDIMSGQTDSKLDHTIDEENDVILRLDTARNLGRLDDFMDKKLGRLKVVHYSIEGDPIFDMLQYAAGRIKVTIDNTLDRFGTPKVRSFTCTQLERQESDTKQIYMLTGCTGIEAEQVQLVRVDYELSAQDRFSFVLKYGKKLKNEINTRDMTLVMDHGASMTEVSDFQLSPQDMQQIYRKLVLANYLETKTLTDRCSSSSGEKYALEVTINGAVRNYAWGGCDKGLDGQQMTEIAQLIIDTVRNNEAYKPIF
ncbi:DUF4362 domain-containing protein [Paenibacillus sp. NFR01]|uniref:DUF4362 domain-containing protein n=1 Tax=Paenibacillus sp. NFR01 TaxID=1566279 RepID=UPI0008CC1152|nr:DUF4362 domain-containing protein [Paenibacillus sp. NFR01]SES90272.1 protein of unknown function [Paenibacillus sp. NFR01]